MPSKKILKPGSKTKYALNPDEVRRLKQAAYCMSKETWATVAILHLTGMHASVLTGLTPENVRGSVLRWVRPKNQKPMVCPIRAELANALQIRFAEGPRIYMIYYTRVRQAGKLAGLPGFVSPHQLRHTHAVELLRAGINPTDVAQIIGTNLEVLSKHYALVRQEDLLKLQEAVASRHP